MRIVKISIFVLLLSSLTVLAAAGLGMTDDSQPAAAQAVTAAMSNISTAAPLASHSVVPAGN